MTSLEDAAISWPVTVKPVQAGVTTFTCGLCHALLATTHESDPPETFSPRALAVAIVVHLQGAPVHSVARDLLTPATN